MPTLGAPELIIVLVIIVLIFGVGKLPEVGQALGKGIREFRGAADADDKEDEAPKPAPAVQAPQPVAAVPAPQPQPVTVAAPAPAPVTVGAPMSAPHAPAAPVGVAPATISYTVETGDTLDSIAQRHGIGIESVMAANGYSQRDRVLYAGDRIQVPTRA